jgi:hypothetical protein
MTRIVLHRKMMHQDTSAANRARLVIRTELKEIISAGRAALGFDKRLR